MRRSVCNRKIGTRENLVKPCSKLSSDTVRRWCYSIVSVEFEDDGDREGRDFMQQHGAYTVVIMYTTGTKALGNKLWLNIKLKLRVNTDV